MMQTGEEQRQQSVQADSGNPFAIVYSPRRAAQAAAESGAWLPLLLLAIAGGFFDYPMLSRLGIAGLIDARLAQTPAGLSSMTIGLFTASQYGAPALLPLAAWLTGSLLAFYLIFLLDARLKSRQVIRVTAWAFLPLAFERIIAGALRLMRLNPDANPFNPLASNAGFFLDPTTVSPFWYNFASGADVFSIWAIAAVSIALGSLSHKPAGSVVPGVIVAWVAGLLLKAALLG